MNQHINAQMRERLAHDLDPLTGEPIQTFGKIIIVDGQCVDATGRAVTLNGSGTWVYA